jgi:diaminohydroxyphosphoribosylaminopyrimidine deaminase/5-amino-6-(5-phosphoribosylamino)uracil reductase
MSISQNKDFLYLKLAFRQAEINLGSTSLNPSVGCIVVRNNSVISSGRTSFNGRPHAEANALKKKIVNGACMYVTLEPCSHYGQTPPCVKNIIKKKLHKVVFPINDSDKRSKNIAHKKLTNSKIKVQRLRNLQKDFMKVIFYSQLQKLLSSTQSLQFLTIT